MSAARSFSPARSHDRYQRRHDELIRAAASVFRRKGYAATTVQDVAEEIGMLKGSLYYYIASKEDLLFEVVGGVCTRLHAATHAATRDVSDPSQRLRAFLEAHVVIGIEEKDALAVLQHDGRALSGERQAWVTGWRLQHEEAVRDLVRRVAGVTGPPLDDATTHLLMRSTLGAVSWVPRWYVRKPTPHPHEVAERVASFAVAGLHGALATARAASVGAGANHACTESGP